MKLKITPLNTSSVVDMVVIQYWTGDNWEYFATIPMDFFLYIEGFSIQDYQDMKRLKDFSLVYEFQTVSMRMERIENERL